MLIYSKGVSFWVAAVGAFVVYPFVSFITVSSNFARWLEFLADLFQREVRVFLIAALLFSLLVVYLLL